GQGIAGHDRKGLRFRSPGVERERPVLTRSSWASPTIPMESLRAPRPNRVMATIAHSTVEPLQAGSPPHPGRQRLPALALGAIGIVFGDIGTSPLYAMKESFIGPHPLAIDRLHILGILSLI